MARLFIAIPLPPELRRALAQVGAALQRILPQIRLSRSDNLHLSLHFLGDQPDDLVAKLEEIMLSVGGCTTAFEIRLSRLGAFPRPEQARVIWVGVEFSPELLRLQQEIGDGLERLGLPPDNRRFCPHLTLGRARGRPVKTDQILHSFAMPENATLRVTQMGLYQSFLRPQGAEHRPLSMIQFL